MPASKPIKQRFHEWLWRDHTPNHKLWWDEDCICELCRFNWIRGLFGLEPIRSPEDRPVTVTPRKEEE